MSRRRQIYEGKAKVLFEGPEPGTLVQHFKDDASAFNNQKRGTITGKGVLNNRISEFLMLKLAEIGIPTHLVRRLNMREQLVREVEIIPIRGSGNCCARRPPLIGSPTSWRANSPCRRRTRPPTSPSFSMSLGTRGLIQDLTKGA